jgi:hypothetical protein
VTQSPPQGEGGAGEPTGEGGAGAPRGEGDGVGPRGEDDESGQGGEAGRLYVPPEEDPNAVFGITCAVAPRTHAPAPLFLMVVLALLCRRARRQ